MRKLVIQDEEVIQEMINFQIQETSESRYLHRLHGILLILNGLSCYEVGRLFNHSPRTIQYWINKANKEGVSGLLDRGRSGRPSRLSVDQIQKIKGDINKSPRKLGYDISLWDGKLLSHHIYKRFKIKLGVRMCQNLFHKLGFTLQRPRYRPARQDEKEREEFKKK